MAVNRLVVGSIFTRGDEILFTFIFSFLSSGVEGKSAALSSATLHAMPPEIGGKWGTECLKTRFPLPTLLFAGYNEKINIINIVINSKWLSQQNGGSTIFVQRT